MIDFAGKIAVITGGGTGMGRALARALVAEGCDVAMCDVSLENMAESRELCMSEAPQGIRVSTFQCDVSIEEQMLAWADHVRNEFDTDHINLLFNNAGIAGGGSFVNDLRGHWEKTFNVCWYGVYYGCRAFMPMLMASEEGHVINTSSVNGFWASLGPQSSHTAYSAAKFAVKGFTEALVNDFRNNAPHLKASVVMPGHIGTSIVINSMQAFSDANEGREVATMMGQDVSQFSDEEIQGMLAAAGEGFRDNAPTTSEQAADIILEGVKSERWRILVGDDAHELDRRVRAYPEDAYEVSFMEKPDPG